MFTLNKLISCVTLVAGAVTGVAVIYSFLSNTKEDDGLIRTEVKGVTVKYATGESKGIGISKFVIGQPAIEVKKPD